MKHKELNLKKLKLDKQSAIDMLRATLISVLISLVAVLIFGIIIKLVDVGDNIILPINQVIKVISLLFGCIFGIKCKSKGVLKGVIIGIVYTLISVFIFWIISGSLKGNFGIIDFISGVITGGVSGVIAVNTGRSKAC